MKLEKRVSTNFYSIFYHRARLTGEVAKNFLVIPSLVTSPLTPWAVDHQTGPRSIVWTIN